MKTFTTTALLSVLTLLFLWSCEKENINPTETSSDLELTERAKGGKKGGPNNDPKSTYSLEYTGPTVSSNLAYIRVTEDSGKRTKLHGFCDESTTLYGLDDLFAVINSSCYESTECSVNIELHQFDKKKLPHRLKASFWFNDDVSPNDPVRFIMYGTITGVFPPTENDPVTTIEFDKWAVNFGLQGQGADPSCAKENGLLSDDGLPNQNMTLTWITDTVDPAYCSNISPACN